MVTNFVSEFVLCFHNCSSFIEAPYSDILFIVSMIIGFMIIFYFFRCFYSAYMVKRRCTTLHVVLNFKIFMPVISKVNYCPLSQS